MNCYWVIPNKKLYKICYFIWYKLQCAIFLMYCKHIFLCIRYMRLKLTSHFPCANLVVHFRKQNEEQVSLIPTIILI